MSHFHTQPMLFIVVRKNIFLSRQMPLSDQNLKIKLCFFLPYIISCPPDAKLKY